jgi:oligopeptide transport system permease protein
MFRFIARRILVIIPVLLIIATMTFFMTRLAPGNPFDTERATTPEIRKQLDAHFNLDKPLYQQYLLWLKSAVLRADLGPSTKYLNRSVNELIAESFPISLQLGAYAIAIALLFGLLAGIVASLRPNTASDYVPMTMAMMGICLPTFVMGPILIYVFGLNLNWFNTSGWFFPSDRVLPSLTLGAYYAAYIARLARGGMLEILNQEYIRTAKAKGASDSGVVFKHALKNGIQPVISFLGPAIVGLITGSFIVETIFQIPGLGRYFVTAATNRDYTMVMGTVLFFAVLILALNLLVDIALAWLNPKVRLQ